MEDFLSHTQKSQHFFSKCIKTFATPSSYVYLTSPSRKFSPLDGCYETYARGASFRNSQCNCGMPTCPATGMNRAYAIGYEVATYTDDKNCHWSMPSHFSILTMQDREDALKFFRQAFPQSIQQVTMAASRTAFYTVLSFQLNSITVLSTKSLVHLDLIIFTLFYILSNSLMHDEVFRAYCLSEDPWDILAQFDPVWNGRHKGSWLARFLAYDALNSNSVEMRSKFSRVKLPLIKGISMPFVTHRLAVLVDNDMVLYKNEPIGSLVMYGDTFWLARPFPEFLSSRALMPSESRQVVIFTEEEHGRTHWVAYLKELRFGRWKTTPQHQKWALWLDRIVHEYL